MLSVHDAAEGVGGVGCTMWAPAGSTSDTAATGGSDTGPEPQAVATTATTVTTRTGTARRSPFERAAI